MSRGRPAPPILKEAFAKQKALREAFDDIRWTMYMAAEEATNGVLLNRKGKSKKIDPFHLFTSNRNFAYCYASEELIGWWESNPRMTFSDYQLQVYEHPPEEDEWSPDSYSEPEPYPVEEEPWTIDDETPF